MMIVFKRLLLIFLIGILTACSSIKEMTPKEAAALHQAEQAVIIDVREPEEWHEQHIEGAIFMPLGEVESRLNELKLYKDKTVIVQCRSGRRSAKAAEIMLNAGFKDVYNLAGGILAWEKAKLETIKAVQ